MTLLHTARLRLEPMNDSHLDGLFAMNSDAEVMRYITGKPDTLADTRNMIDLVKARWEQFGFSWWSFFEIETDTLVGAGCIQHLGRDPANSLETGWRLRRDRWGRGYASEAAQAMAAFAFDTLHSPDLVAVCDPDNHASSHVMKKLGMRYRGLEHWYNRDMAVYAMQAADFQRR